MAAVSASAPLRVVVPTYELSACPVTAMEAAYEFYACPAMAKEAGYELSAFPVTAKEAIYELSACPKFPPSLPLLPTLLILLYFSALSPQVPVSPSAQP